MQLLAPPLQSTSRLARWPWWLASRYWRPQGQLGTALSHHTEVIRISQSHSSHAGEKIRSVMVRQQGQLSPAGSNEGNKYSSRADVSSTAQLFTQTGPAMDVDLGRSLPALLFEYVFCLARP